jgi:hypothetical protein
MRGLLLLLGCFLTACAVLPRTASKADCVVEERGVVVTMRGASWHRLVVAQSEPVVHGTHFGLMYTINLDPDPMADRRAYAGLADHATLYVTFGSQFARGVRRDPYVVELHGDGLSIARSRNQYGQAVFSGTDLDRLLGGASDIVILLRDAQGEVLRQERLTRNELIQVDTLMRGLSGQLSERLVDPARLCAPEEEIIVT